MIIEGDTTVTHFFSFLPPFGPAGGHAPEVVRAAVWYMEKRVVERLDSINYPKRNKIYGQSSLLWAFWLNDVALIPERGSCLRSPCSSVSAPSRSDASVYAEAGQRGLSRKTLLIDRRCSCTLMGKPRRVQRPRLGREGRSACQRIRRAVRWGDR